MPGRHRRIPAPPRGATVSRARSAIPVTDGYTQVTHQVNDEAMALGRPVGRYRALCGDLVLAASLAEPGARSVPHVRVVGGVMSDAIQAPPPRFPHKFPAGRRSSAPVESPGGQPDPMRVPARWARCPVDQRLHLLAPLAIAAAALVGHGHALCGRRIPAAGLVLSGVSAPPCLSCLAAGTGS